MMNLLSIFKKTKDKELLAQINSVMAEGANGNLESRIWNVPYKLDKAKSSKLK